MKLLKKALELFEIAIGMLILIPFGMILPTWTPAIKRKNSISLLEAVEINGTKQEIMIRGWNVSNPVVIYVHGGPGCPETPYLRKYQDLLEKNFTVVNYDQRASGKSFHFFEDYARLSAEILVEDLIALTDYILARLGKEKVLLIGHSYGSYIAIQAAARAPEKYLAYIGVGQMSDIRAHNKYSLEYCISQAEKAGNRKDSETLKQLSSDILNRNLMTPAKYIRRYKGSSRLINYFRDYVVGFILNPEYNLLDIIRYVCGIKVTMKAIQYEPTQKPITGLVKKIGIPCYFVMGKYDYMTSTQAAKEFFDLLEAEKKEFIEYEDSAHFPNFEEKERFTRWMAKEFK